MKIRNKYPPFTPKQIDFIRRNHLELTNQQFADYFKMPYRSFAHRKAKLGIRNMEMQKWTPVQVRFLRKWYKRRGDLELARMFTTRWAKKKGWTLKHIEKKRNYLQLHRTAKQIAAIKERHRKAGVYIRASKKTWKTRGVKPNGHVAYWRSKSGREVPFIKIEGKYQLWSRWYWRKHCGPIPYKMMICFIDGDPRNRKLSNLKLARANNVLTDAVVVGRMTFGHPEIRELIRKEYPDLIKIQRQLIMLKRTMYEFQQKAS